MQITYPRCVDKVGSFPSSGVERPTQVSLLWRVHGRQPFGTQRNSLTGWGVNFNL